MTRTSSNKWTLIELSSWFRTAYPDYGFQVLETNGNEYAKHLKFNIYNRLNNCIASAMLPAAPYLEDIKIAINWAMKIQDGQEELIHVRSGYELIGLADKLGVRVFRDGTGEVVLFSHSGEYIIGPVYESIARDKLHQALGFMRRKENDDGKKNIVSSDSRHS